MYNATSVNDIIMQIVEAFVHTEAYILLKY